MNKLKILILAGMWLVIGGGPLWAADNTVTKGNAYKAVVPLLKNPKTIIGETITYPGGGEAEIVSAIVTIQPGEKTQWHKHGAPLYAYILSGTATVDYGDLGTKTYPAGTDFMEAMDHWHRGMNLSQEPVRILAVYLGSKGHHNVILKDKSK